MSRLIDADALKEKINTAFLSEIGKLIDNAPTIDAVSVVRCKDCRYYRADDYSGVFHCFFNSNAVTDDDFCSYGEREGE